MNSSSEKLPRVEGDKKRQMWRKLFWLNLCVTLVLVGSFWLPEKLIRLQKFLDSPSVDIPEEGKIAQKEEQKKVPINWWAVHLPKKNLFGTHIQALFFLDKG